MAAEVGYDGVELMVGVEKATTDIDSMAVLSRRYGVAVLSVHAPCLVVTPKVWTVDHWSRLRLTCQAAQRLSANLVVVHPPFRWQRGYARTFAQGIRRLQTSFDVTIAVENMYPWRIPRGQIQGYLPSWDPTDLDYDSLALDLSHASVAQVKAIDFVHAWGERLAHVHLTDGNGSALDKHLFPGCGDQDAWNLVAELGARGYDGHIIHEIDTRALTDAERVDALADCLSKTRTHFERGHCARGHFESGVERDSSHVEHWDT